MMNSFFMAIWLTIWILYIYFCSRSEVYSWSEQAASLNLLAGSRNSLKRDILLCRRTKVLATNLIFIRCWCEWWSLSHKRIINTTFFGNLNNFSWHFMGGESIWLNSNRHLYWGWFSEDQFSNVMRRDWILIALMSLKARLYSFLYTRCPIINQAGLFYKIIIVKRLFCGPVDWFILTDFWPEPGPNK